MPTNKEQDEPEIGGTQEKSPEFVSLLTYRMDRAMQAVTELHRHRRTMSRNEFNEILDGLYGTVRVLRTQIGGLCKSRGLIAGLKTEYSAALKNTDPVNKALAALGILQEYAERAGVLLTTEPPPTDYISVLRELVIKDTMDAWEAQQNG